MTKKKQTQPAKMKVRDVKVAGKNITVVVDSLDSKSRSKALDKLVKKVVGKSSYNKEAT